MSAHTPGPWQVEARKGETWVCRADSAVLARVAAAKEQKANARLIAAAPDLLFQLLSAANYVDALGGDSKSYRAAIARATGGQA